MVSAAYFTKLVARDYGFMVEEYGFEYLNTEDIPRQIFVNYRKDELLVIVKYSRTNYYIEVSLYNHVPIQVPPEYQLKSRVMLMSLIYRDNPGFDYNAIMPKLIQLEESVKQTAALLKNHGAAILAGKEWWQDPRD